jgi:DNA polymerase-3 subunit delta'
MLKEVQHQAEGTALLRKVVEGSQVSPLLLLGPEGTGRKFSVLCAMREKFCVGTKDVTCACASCYQIRNGRHPDVMLVDASQKEIGIDAVREVIEEARQFPSAADIRCVVIDGVDHFTLPAANAFLKTLEEPPASTRFFLLAEDQGKVLPTIKSRCGVVRYHLLPEEFVKSVVSKHERDEDKALVYSRMGEGSAGRALHYCKYGKLSTRDQSFRILQMALEKDLLGAFTSINAMEKELKLGLTFLTQLLHDVLIVQLDPMRVINVDLSKDLALLSNRAPIRTWISLSRRLDALRVQARATTLNLGFQTKTILAETFI